MASFITLKNAKRFLQAYAAYKLYRTFYPAKVKDIAGMTILVTGAASGVGKTLTLMLASRQDIGELVLWDIQEAELAKTVEEVLIVNPNQKVSSMLIDLSKRENIYAAASECVASLGDRAPDVVVNNAGIISGNQQILDTSDERVELEFKINTLSHFWMFKAFLPKMIERGTGHFVNVASMAAYLAAPDMVSYAASKSAAKALSAGLHAELMHHGHTNIAVSCVCPGHIDTKLFEGFQGNNLTMTPETVAAHIIEAIECEIPLMQLPRILMAPIPFIAGNEMLGNLVPKGIVNDKFNPMKKWKPLQANKIFDEMKLKSAL